jgi:1-acyl-sn-glycerol-3-phosphate acyltransferase
MSEVRYYSSYEDDFIMSDDQEYELQDDYKWYRKDVPFKIASFFVYGAAVIASSVWCRAHLHVRIIGKEKIKKAARGGAFIFGNHTQPIGDVFIPALASFPKRIYTVVSPSNMGLKGIGKFLPALGALPIPKTLSQMRSFSDAVSRRLEEGKIITVYPEAHVWEYCEEIRPFVKGAAAYPVRFSRPAFSMTATYQDRRRGRPRANVYIDGPFYPNDGLPPRERERELGERIKAQMEERAKLSNSGYIKYIKKQAE